ncbi:antibiotic biosynthesis monooxygenase [Mesorhizobium sp. ISC25]|uniref:antibiotic biosynthesis monooxygenase n=1 Tax=Mesorhizobium sp. ISC25 TaxID=3077335 RepID=UPI0035DA1352
MVFDIAPTDKGTELRFTHVGLKPSEECYDVCHDSWHFYIASLRDLISKGSGQPNKGEENANPTVVPQNENIGLERMAASDGAEMIVMTTAAAKPGIESKVRDALRDVAGAARKQSGCIDYSVFRSRAEPNVTICVERWASRQERDAFLGSADAKNFVSAITGAFLERPSPISYTTLEVGS